MEIQAITETEIDAVVHDISTFTTKHLLQFAAEKRETALLSQLRASGKPQKEQVLEYLQRTERKGILNRYVSANLRISAVMLKAIRIQLAAEGKILVYLNHKVIHLTARIVDKT